MMYVIVVDDDDKKVQCVKDAIYAVLPNDQVLVDVATTVSEGSLALERQVYDVVILDLNLPMRKGEAARPDGGFQLLTTIDRSLRVMRPRNIIGLTEYDALHSRYAVSFQEKMWFLIHFDPRSDEWVQRISDKLIYLFGCDQRASAGFGVDLAVMTALERTELESVLELPGRWSISDVSGDSTVYHRGRFERDQRRVEVVAAAATQMGMPAATALAMKLIYSFRPRVLVMVGIAAGVEGDFGDILIADSTWAYESGKRIGAAEEPSRLHPAPFQLPIDPQLRARLGVVAGDRKLLDRIRSGWLGGGAPKHLQVHIGPVASGSAVLQCREVVDELKGQNRKLIGVEMETYGLFVAGYSSSSPRPMVASIKSICDFADYLKSDEYQKYAAYTSSRFLYEFVLSDVAQIGLNRATL
jgi:nucleoside phosphorylase/CheY-like chemotaxis protein